MVVNDQYKESHISLERQNDAKTFRSPSTHSNLTAMEACPDE